MGLGNQYQLFSAVTEALATRETGFLLQARKFTGASVFSDSETIISLASSDLEPPWEVAAIINDIRTLSKPLDIKWCFSPKKYNIIAH